MELILVLLVLLILVGLITGRLDLMTGLIILVAIVCLFAFFGNPDFFRGR